MSSDLKESIFGNFWSLTTDANEAGKQMRIGQYAAYLMTGSYFLRGLVTDDSFNFVVGFFFLLFGIALWRKFYFITPILVALLTLEAAGNIVLRISSGIFNGLFLSILILGICFVSIKGWLAYRRIKTYS